MREFSDCDDQIEAIAELPPSSKLILKVLQYNERLTRDELQDRTQLSARTVREATTRLRNLGVITIESGRGDATQLVYAIASVLTQDPDVKQGKDGSED